ncbi:NimC/NimA family protein [Anaerocolumna cellulosilytica]|uniref:NimC/NimA family protein n=1 Tax=Anaerocolumna cellulosilytica TaxID=433286 RepID=A0A6S6RBW7_9FIRM|nr:pyridoxamine 5'-phosphate oxidase family protein [Anaerocolumna cellulosilytica]MBB5198104.1 putative pyridoxamine 5'-phosphate oxidase family protein [Anaerocolumna cellulosilytica]BCJ96505.1 NimC/NimA family protein [Anaerocolumna cellulosilytica]
MNKAAQFLADCGTFYIATVEKDQPRVRPFGAVVEWDGKTYICTNNKKDVFAQMKENPKVEISAMNNTGNWIRISGKLAADPRREAKEAMLKAYPSLTKMYSLDDGIYEVLYFTEGTATIYSFGAEPEVFNL